MRFPKYDTKLCSSCGHTEYSHIMTWSIEKNRHVENCEYEIEKGIECYCEDFIWDEVQSIEIKEAV